MNVVREVCDLLGKPLATLDTRPTEGREQTQGQLFLMSEQIFG